MNQELLKEITQGQIKAEKAAFKVGDGVRVHTKVREGDKERIQVFAGIVIAGEGVERVFPVNSPNVEKVEVERESVPMRARLYYLRDRVGREASKVKEKRV